jgi:hypothetical protein
LSRAAIPASPAALVAVQLADANAEHDRQHEQDAAAIQIGW